MLMSTMLRVLDFKPFRGRKGPEDLLSIDVATMLRAATLEGRLDAVWTMIPHELGGAGKLAAIRVALAKAMGLIAGSGDFVFVWPTGGGFIELKVRAALSPAQQDFRDWCIGSGNRYAVCKSVNEVEAKLREWGALT